VLYRPLESTLWDTLIYNDNGTFHLFYLRKHGLGHATSSDLATWQAAPTSTSAGTRGSGTRRGAPLTGWITKRGDVFYLFAGAVIPDSGESVYGVFTSQDLANWAPHSDNPVLRAPEGERHGSDRDWGMFDAWRRSLYCRRS